MENRVQRLVEKTLGVRMLTKRIGGRAFSEIRFDSTPTSILFDPVSHTATSIDVDESIERICEEWLGRSKAYVEDPYAVDLIRSIEYYATSACNLGCSYCYLGKLPAKVSQQEKGAEGAIRVITKLFADNRIGPDLDFLLIGGEPLLARSGIEKITQNVVELAKHHNTRLVLRITTNGSALSQYSLDWLAAQKFEVTLSYDGPFQAVNRPLKFGGASVVRLEDAIDALGSEKIVVKATLLSGQLGLQARVFESLRNRGARKIYINAAYGVTEATDKDIVENIEGINDLDSHCQAGGLVEGHLAEAAYARKNGVLASSHCSAGLSHIVLDLDSAGHISSCANVREKGRFEARYPSNYDVDDDPVCGACAFRYICNAVGGGCRAWRVIANSAGPDALACSASISRFVLAFRRLAFKNGKTVSRRSSSVSVEEGPNASIHP